MKFETPKMNISIFATENVVVTDSSIAKSGTYQNAQTALTTAIGGNAGTGREAANNIFAFEY